MEVATARRFVADTLTDWQAIYDRDWALLLVSELVTNAVIHARTDIALTVRWDGRVVTVEVHDRSDQMPARRKVTPTATKGRGLELVAAIADRWGVHASPGDGKIVWFTLTPEEPAVAGGRP